LFSGPIDDAVSHVVVAQLLFLETEDPEKDIAMYINSPGGSVTSGFAIHDTMNFVKCDVSTICIGGAASMGSFLLAAGTKGKRISLPNTDIMIHQPLGGCEGQATDMEIRTQHILRTRKKLNKYLAEYTGQTLKQIEKDTERDNFMNPKQALDYGLIDKIVTSRSDIESD